MFIFRKIKQISQKLLRKETPPEVNGAAGTEGNEESAMQIDEAIRQLVLGLLRDGSIRAALQEAIAKAPAQEGKPPAREGKPPAREGASAKQEEPPGAAAAGYAEAAALSQEKAALEESNRRLLEENARIRDACEEKNERLKQARAGIDNLQSRLAEAEQRVRAAEERASQFEVRASHLEAACAEAKQRIRAAEERASQFEVRASHLEAACTEAKQRFRAAEERASQSEVRASQALAACKEAEQMAREREAMSEPFRELLACYNAYRASANSQIKSVLPDRDPVTFLAVGSQRDTLLRFWDALRDAGEDGSGEGTAALINTLRYLIERYNSTLSSPVLQLMEDERGKPFNESRHSRSRRCSRYQGAVERIIMPGIWNNNLGKAERKTVVYFA